MLEGSGGLRERPTSGRTGARGSWLLAAVMLVASVVVAPGAEAASVAANAPVTPASPAAYQQPSLARDPAHPGRLAIAYQDASHFKSCYLASSPDNGSSWSQTAVIGDGASYPVPSGFSTCRDPHIAFGPDGTLYYVVTVSGSTLHQANYVMVSGDGGASFSAPAPVDPNRLGADLWPSITVDPSVGPSGRVYVSYSHAPCAPSPPGQPPCSVDESCQCNAGIYSAGGGVRVMVASSTDAGKTFTAPTQVNASGRIGDFAIAAVGGDGRLYEAWLDDTEPFYSTGPGQGTVAVASSTDAAKTFTAPVDVGTVASWCTAGFVCDDLHYNDPGAYYLAIAAGQSPGSAYVAWWDYRGGLSRIIFASTQDAAASWSTPTVIAVPAGRSGDHQYRPAMALSPGGRIDIAYYDLSPSGLQDVFWTSSEDGGGHFASPVRLTDTSSNVSVGPSTGGGKVAKFGRHLAIDSLTDGLLAAWTDSRRGSTENAKQDIYFTSIDTRPTPTTSSTAAGPGYATGTGTGIASRSGPCVTSPGFGSVSGRPAGAGIDLRFTTLSRSPVLVEVFASTRGSRAIGAKRVAVFRDRTQSFTWNGRTGRRHVVPDGYYWVRYRTAGQNGRPDVRREAYARRHDRFSRLPEFSRPDNLCGLIEGFGLSAPAFGGPTQRSLNAAFRLAARGDVTLKLLRGRRVLATITRRGVAAKRAYTVAFTARHRRRGSYQVRILARSGRHIARDTLTSRRL